MHNRTTVCVWWYPCHVVSLVHLDYTGWAQRGDASGLNVARCPGLWKHALPSKHKYRDRETDRVKERKTHTNTDTARPGLSNHNNLIITVLHCHYIRVLPSTLRKILQIHEKEKFKHFLVTSDIKDKILHLCTINILTVKL